MNVVAIVGRLTSDPKTIDTKSGDPMVAFRIAFNHKEDDASFFNCVAFGKTAELIDDYMSKGRRIGVQGYLRQRDWEDKDGEERTTVEIVATNVTFLDSKKDNDNDSEKSSSRKSSRKSSSRKTTSNRSSKSSRKERDKEPPEEDDDDDLPF